MTVQSRGAAGSHQGGRDHAGTSSGRSPIPCRSPSRTAAPRRMSICFCCRSRSATTTTRKRFLSPASWLLGNLATVKAVLEVGAKHGVPEDEE